MPLNMLTQPIVIVRPLWAVVVALRSLSGLLGLGLLWCLHATAQPAPEDAPPPPALAADMFEAVTKLPLTVQDMYGKSIDGQMVLTYFKPAGDGPFAAVIMNHGRNSEQRTTPARFSLSGHGRCALEVKSVPRIGRGRLTLRLPPPQSGHLRT